VTDAGVRELAVLEGLTRLDLAATKVTDAVFPKPKAAFQRGHVPFPYSICIIEAARKPT